MLEFLVDNIFVEFWGHVFQQTIGIPMRTNGTRATLGGSVPTFV